MYKAKNPSICAQGDAGFNSKPTYWPVKTVFNAGAENVAELIIKHFILQKSIFIFSSYAYIALNGECAVKTSHRFTLLSRLPQTELPVGDISRCATFHAHVTFNVL